MGKIELEARRRGKNQAGEPRTFENKRVTKKERGGKFFRAGVLGEEMGGTESHSGKMRERLSTDPSRRGGASVGGVERRGKK